MLNTPFPYRHAYSCWNCTSSLIIQLRLGKLLTIKLSYVWMLDWVALVSTNSDAYHTISLAIMTEPRLKVCCLMSQLGRLWEELSPPPHHHSLPPPYTLGRMSRNQRHNFFSSALGEYYWPSLGRCRMNNNTRDGWILLQWLSKCVSTHNDYYGSRAARDNKKWPGSSCSL